MSYTWEYLQRNHQEAKRLVGINYEQLIQLIEQAKFLHEQRQTEIEINRTRLINTGGGRKSQLSLEEQIILTLIYLRHHLIFKILGLLFQVSESTANNIFNYWHSLLRESTPASLLEQVKKYEFDSKINALINLQSLCPKWD
ncbi:MAG: transposase family protein [Symploca sp. SIO3C6]|uniref:Transposase family protein n=1 Tax=Symploca sp. SIO1C4 TaxID=2607765 RepID=A0A6B3NGA9_9CYAN|nr:transposase family protein [Symploca sp. SIO3C6]NER30700.1 transposase family protein [Symploca sp. SIO1C4]NET07349.1 transposase family protein [Symploca sp. SIO2B6]NET53506.1 transposase family protein [Merismopedia sp. SIO2A8]